MRFFYIDYENVKDNGLNGVAKLLSSDVVKIFYSEDAQRMSFGTHRRIIESKASFVYQKLSSEMKTIKNALDVLILQDLDNAMKSDKMGEYYIISDDKDFDGFIGEKQKKKYKVKRIGEICQASATSVKSTEKTVQSSNSNSQKAKDNVAEQKQRQQELEVARRKKEQTIRSHIGKYLKEYNDSKEDIVEAYMASSSRQELNNNLQKYFYNDDVSEILGSIKSLIKDMPGR